MCVFHSQMHVPIRAWKCRTNISTGMHTKIMMNTHEVQKFPVAKTVFQAQVPYSREVKKSCHTRRLLFFVYYLLCISTVRKLTGSFRTWTAGQVTFFSSSSADQIEDCEACDL